MKQKLLPVLQISIFIYQFNRLILLKFTDFTIYIVCSIP